MKKFLPIFPILLALSFPVNAVPLQPLGTVDLLKDLIRIDTSNPPGNEIKAARYIQSYLSKFGIVSEILESEPGRASLIARLKGSGEKETLALIGHLDVVPADPKEWDHPPFEAVMDGDYLHGRGSLDMKSLDALEINTLIRLKQENFPLKGDVILVLTADEEAGGKLGAQFLTEKHWDKVKARYVFNEGSIGVIHEGKNLYPIQVAEKGVVWLKLTARGTSGHGSMPTTDNAVLRLLKAIRRVSGPQPIQRTEVVEGFLNRLSEEASFPRSWIMRHFFDWPIVRLAPRIAGEWLKKQKALNAMIRDTISPTMLQAGYKINVIPAEAVAFLDARILPGETPEEFIKKLQEKIGDPDVKIETVMESLPNQSDFKTPYFEVIEKAILTEDPTATVAPYMSPGATDSRFFRAKGAICYGLIPVVASQEEIDTIHGKNERVRVSGLARGEKILYNIVTSLQGAGDHR